MSSANFIIFCAKGSDGVPGVNVKCSEMRFLEFAIATIDTWAWLLESRVSKTWPNFQAIAVCSLDELKAAIVKESSPTPFQNLLSAPR